MFNCSCSIHQATSFYSKLDLRKVGHMISIQSENEIGLSVQATMLHIPEKKLEPPQHFKQILQITENKLNQYVLNWTAPLESFNIPILSYTIFWCSAFMDGPNACQVN